MESKGRLLLRTLTVFSQLLESYRDRIDLLNVYPVPDGDTGTNMYFTVRSAVELIEQKDLLQGPDSCGVDCLKEISRAALLGARGNSGVILAQIISSFCGVFGEDSRDKLSWLDIKDSLVVASKKARAAVLKPVEGTILTVLSDLAKRADAESFTNSGIDQKLQHLFDCAQASLERTPSQLEQLQRAGVVDSGGAGLVLFMASICRSFGVERFAWGQKRSFLFEAWVPKSDFRIALSIDGDDTEGAITGPKYEVMFVLEANEVAIMGFKDVWAGLGDSIVVVGDENLYNCHIHTDDIGASIEAGIQAGQISRIRVTDFNEQIREERWVVDAHGAGAPNPLVLETSGAVETAVVAIAAGDGVRRIFRSLGVHRIVVGGPSMNPSTQEILAALESVPSNNVIVLSNSSNVIPVVQLAIEISKKIVKIIPTAGIIEGLSALVEFDPMIGIDENLKRMSRSAESVKVVEITRAVRDYSSDVGQVAIGNYIGFSGQGLISISDSLVKVAVDAIRKIIDDSAEIITFIEGDGSSTSVTREITEEISGQFPNLQIEIHHGAQPHYPYLIGIE